MRMVRYAGCWQQALAGSQTQAWGASIAAPPCGNPLRSTQPAANRTNRDDTFVMMAVAIGVQPLGTCRRIRGGRQLFAILCMLQRQKRAEGAGRMRRGAGFIGPLATRSRTRRQTERYRVIPIKVD